MTFRDNLDKLPAADNLTGLNILDADGRTVHHIPAKPGKMGSLRVYYALAQQFHDRLDTESARHGLALFAEFVQEAEAEPGKHPNIDLLLAVIAGGRHYTLEPLEDDI